MSRTFKTAAAATIYFVAVLIALALLFMIAEQPADAQIGTSSNPGYVLGISPPTPGSSMATPACTGDITSTTAALTSPAGSCTAAFATGVGTLGPFVSAPGSAVRVVVVGTWTGSYYIGTSVDNCVTIRPLTILGTATTYGSNSNEFVDSPVASLPAIGYCAVATITSGTASIALRN